MNQPTELTLEQEFALKSFQSQVEHMSREQAQDFLIKLYESMMIRETMYRDLIKTQWGFTDGLSIPKNPNMGI